MANSKLSDRKFPTAVRSVNAIQIHAKLIIDGPLRSALLDSLDIMRVNITKDHVTHVLKACSDLRTVMGLYSNPDREGPKSSQEKIEQILYKGAKVDWIKIMGMLDDVLGKEDAKNRLRHDFKRALACQCERLARITSYGGIPANVKKPECWPEFGLSLAKYFPFRYPGAKAQNGRNEDNWPYIPSLVDIYKRNNPAVTGEALVEGPIAFERRMAMASCIGGAHMPWCVVDVIIPGFKSGRQKVNLAYKLPQFLLMDGANREKLLATFSMDIWGQPRMGSAKRSVDGEPKPKISGLTILKSFKEGIPDRNVEPDNEINIDYRQSLYNDYREMKNVLQKEYEEREARAEPKAAASKGKKMTMMTEEGPEVVMIEMDSEPSE